MKGYFERALDEEPKLAAKNYPFWGWANNMSGWLKPSGHLSDGYVPATTRENWVPFEDDSAEVLAWAEAHRSRKDGKDVAS